MNSILVDFDLLVDKDFGIYKLIKNDYKDNGFIDDMVLIMKDKVILGELLTRKESNPLSIILKKEFKNSIDNLYEEFNELEYENILKYSITTSILELMRLYVETANSNVMVICKNKSEEQIINKYNLKTTLYSNLSELDISQYDSIFIKEYRKVIEFKNLKAKNIFIGRYNFNLEEDEYTPIEDISILVADTNIVSVIDVYESDKYILLKG